MPNRRHQRHYEVRLLVLSLWVLSIPAVGSAATERPQSSGMGPTARTEIRIALSVRPTVSFRPAMAATGDGHWKHGTTYCFWSNSPVAQYNLAIEIQPARESSMPDVVVQSGDPGCLTQGPVITLLNKLETSFTNVQSSNVVTLMISPQ